MNKKSLKTVLVILFFFIMLVNNLIVPYNVLKNNSNINDDIPVQKIKQASIALWSYMTNGSIRIVAISADGQYIAAGSEDKNIYLFDRSSSTPLWNYTTGNLVRSVAISADGQYIAAGSYDYHVYLFNRSSSTPLWNYTTGERVTSVAISADGQYIVAGSYDCHVYLFNRSSSTPLWNYSSGFVESVSISADGEYITAGDGSLLTFRRSSSTPLPYFYTYQAPIKSVAISANGEYLAAGTYGGTGETYIHIIDVDNPNYCLMAKTGDWIPSVSSSADGQYFAAGSWDYNVYLSERWGNLFWSYTTGGRVNSVAISANGRYIAAGSNDEKMYVFNKSGSTPVWNYTTGGSVNSVAFSADGRYIAAGSSDNKTYLFYNNFAPDPPYNPSPSDEATSMSNSPVLKVNVSDQDGDPMTVRFYDASDDSLIGVNTSVESGEIASVTWSGLSDGTIYSWYAVADDGMETNQSPIWTFRTNIAPSAPTNPLPTDGFTGVSTTLILRVDVSDLDGDVMTVRFYDASDDSLIGTDMEVINGTSASITWSGLSYGTIYSWYVIVDDGKNTTQSITWTFETNYHEDSVAIPGYLPMALISILLISMAGLILYLHRRIQSNNHNYEIKGN